jgi:predicted TIM-barrel fold metal-dependent hydrolase
MAVLHKYNIDDPMVDPVMEMTRERGMVASIHSGSDDVVHPNRIANVAARFPDVPIIMDHMGYPNATEEAIRAAEEHPNIYLGTTILLFFRQDPSQANPTAAIATGSMLLLVIPVFAP